MPPIPVNPNVAQRKIYFHKVVPRTGEPVEFHLDRAAVVQSISALGGTPQFYLPEGAPEEEQNLCAVVDRTGAPHRFRFYRVRRRNLPETEAEGDFEALELDERRGLAESIHVVLFDDNVVGSEYNHYGPRATTLATFLNERCGQDVYLRQLVRGDVISDVLKMRDIRRLRIKAEPTEAAALRDRASGIGGAVDAATTFAAGKYVDLTLAADPGDADFTQRAKSFIRSIRSKSARAHLEALQVYGKSEDGLLEGLDLLHDSIVLNREIERESPRSRALDRDDAYRAVEDAYNEIQPELGQGGTITVES